MLDKINNYYERVKPNLLKFYKTLDRSWIKYLILSFIFGYSVYYIITQFNNLQNAIRNIDLNYQTLFFSSLIIIITIIFSTLSWMLILRSLGTEIPIIESAYIQLLSSIGKYIPGHIWNFSGRVLLSKSFGLPIKISSTSIIIELLFHYLLGLIISITFFPTDFFSISKPFLTGLKIMIIILLLIIFLLIFQLLKRNMLPKVQIDTKFLICAFVLRFFIWAFSSYSFILLLISIGLTQINITTAMSVISTSYVAGFIAFITPDGIFIRELIISLFLRNYLLQPDAIVSSVLLRFQLIVCEFLSIVVIIILRKIIKKKPRIESA